MHSVGVDGLPTIGHGVAIRVPDFGVGAPNKLVVRQPVGLGRVQIQIGIGWIRGVDCARVSELPPIPHAVTIRINIVGITAGGILVTIHQAISVEIIGAIRHQQVDRNTVRKLPTVRHAVAIRIGIERVGVVDVVLIHVRQAIIIRIQCCRVHENDVGPRNVVRGLDNGIVGVDATRFPRIKNAVCIRVAEGCDTVRQKRIQVREGIGTTDAGQGHLGGRRIESLGEYGVNRPRLCARISY